MGSAVNINTGAFQGCKKLDLVYFNKSVQSISGLPDYIGRKYLCKNQECGCNFGYGNVHDDQTDLFRCESCQAGKVTDGHNACQDCGYGSYASQIASAKCTFCPKG